MKTLTRNQNAFKTVLQLPFPIPSNRGGPNHVTWSKEKLCLKVKRPKIEQDKHATSRGITFRSNVLVIVDDRISSIDNVLILVSLPSMSIGPSSSHVETCGHKDPIISFSLAFSIYIVRVNKSKSNQIFLIS